MTPPLPRRVRRTNARLLVRWAMRNRHTLTWPEGEEPRTRAEARRRLRAEAWLNE